MARARQAAHNAPGVLTPQGRLTLTTATPVMTAEAAAQTTIYYTPYVGDRVALYNGTEWGNKQFTELSIAMAADADWAADSNFDLFIYDDGGTLRLVTGAAWTNGTTRAEALVRTNGIWLNNASFTGRYGAAAGGDPGRLYVWNCYHRVSVAVDVRDSDNSWAYSTASWRKANNSDNNRVSFVQGLQEDALSASYVQWIQLSATVNNGLVGVGLDGTSAPSFGSTNQAYIDTFTGTVVMPATAMRDGPCGVGFHFLSAIELGNAGAGGTIFYGDAGNATDYSTCFTVRGRF